MIDTTYPRHYLEKDQSIGLTKKLVDISVNNLQEQIDKANKSEYTQKIIETLSDSMDEGGVYGVCMETANNILQVAIMTGLVTNTSHAVCNHNAENYGKIVQLKELDVKTPQLREQLTRNLPYIMDITGQQLSGYLDVMGYNKIGFNIYDLHYSNMIYYDYDKYGNIKEYKKK